MIESVWHGCYNESWKGLITDDSFAHPAKFAPGLIKRILAHGLECGWWQRGDLLGDPFGGIAGGGIMAAYAGLNWIGVELEEKFVELGGKNIALHAPTWRACGDASFVKLVQGDSRRFSEIVGEISAAVSSPPYANSLDSGGADTQHPDGCVRHMHGVKDRYGKTPGQIGNLPDHPCDAGVMTSPPYAEGKTHPSLGHPELVNGGKGDFLALATTGAGRGSERYGDTPGNIGNLRAGALAGAVTSPPYADTAVEKSSGSIDMRKNWETYRASGGGSSFEAYCRQQVKHSAGYGGAKGQIAALKSGDVDAVVSSPPYAASNMKPTGFGTGKATRGQGDSAGRNKGDYHHPESDGQIGNLPEGGFNEDSNGGLVTTPSTREGEWGSSLDPQKNSHPQNRSAKYIARNKSAEGYGDTDGQIGRDAGETYWQAMHAVYGQCLLAIKPGGYMAVVVKDYVKNKARVPLCDQTLQLLVAIGFEPVERIRAMLVKSSTREGLFETVTKTTERKSFFRRLAEKKGSPRIDWEEVIVVRKPGGES